MAPPSRPTGSHLSRRQFLRVSGTGGLLALGPLDLLIDALVDGVVGKAHAQTSGNAEPRNLISFSLQGGGPLWYWQAPLTPFVAKAQPTQADGFFRNNAVNTKFDANGNPVYATTPIVNQGTTFWMPHLWSVTIPVPGGGSVAMSTLMDHMCSIRGYDCPDDHPTAGPAPVRPAQDKPSLPGLVAFASKKPLPAVGMTRFNDDTRAPANNYRTLPGGPGQLKTEFGFDVGDTPLHRLLTPFDASGLNAAKTAERLSLETAMNNAMLRLKTQAEGSLPGAASLYSEREKALVLLKRGLGDLQVGFDSLFSKYQTLIQRCTSSIPGITDQPINNPKDNSVRASIGGNDNAIPQNADLRTVITATTDARFMAESFAVAEFLIANGYSSSYVTHLTGIVGLNLEGTGESSWGFDEHNGGALLSLVVNGFFYRSLSACLYELIRVLKAAPSGITGRTLFDETVIQISGDFNGSPRGDLSGFDHGWQGGATVLLSGAIKKYIVVGNCVQQHGTGGAAADYYGSWGVAATVNHGGVVAPLHHGHVASTICHLLRVEAPLPNNPSVLYENPTTGVVEAAVEPAANKVETYQDTRK